MFLYNVINLCHKEQDRVCILKKKKKKKKKKYFVPQKQTEIKMQLNRRLKKALLYQSRAAAYNLFLVSQLICRAGHSFGTLGEENHGIQFCLRSHL